jgi:hypothetical protein
VSIPDEAGSPGGASGGSRIDASSGDDRPGTGGASNAGGTAGSGGSPGGAGGSGGAGGNGGSGATAGAAGPTSGAGGTTVGAGGTTGGAGGAGRGGASGGRTDASDGPDISAPPDAARDAPPDGRTPCPSFTCLPLGGTLCGLVCDSCDNEVDCGSCPSGQVCGPRIPGVCAAPCPLCSQVAKCETGFTTVRGTVVTGAPTNPDPVPGAMVLVPNVAPGGKLPPVTAGPSCMQCGWVLQDDQVVASALTGPDGNFVLFDVPAGPGIPLVVQLGDWRYETTIDVVPCTNNVLPLGKARLPRVQSEGNIPLTAISTGNVDALECTLRKMGIADSEFSNPNGSGRIHFYRNNGAVYDMATPNQAALVDTAAWDRYDQILFACEGSQTAETATALQNFVDYTSRGGRVLATHFSYTWLYQNGGFAQAGAWQPNQLSPPSPLISNIDTTTRTGGDFATWLGLTGALYNPVPPQVAINDPRHNLNAVPMGSGGQRWIYVDNPANVQAMVVDTPITTIPDVSCGRVVYTDFHVANASNGALTFPAECPTTDLTPQEKILEYMLLHLQGCGPQVPPPVPPPPPPPKMPPCR